MELILEKQFTGSIVVVDHPLVSEGISSLISKDQDSQAIATLDDPKHIAPPESLVLIELFLPEHRCGLQLAQQLQNARPDLTTIVWTTHPTALFAWAALEYKISGFLDKSLAKHDLLYWFKHALSTGTAWPGTMLIKAREWNNQAALQLRDLTHHLWLLWGGLLRDESILDLASQLGWSKRTIERRLTELYTILGVHSRSELINLAWQWGLVEMYDNGIYWCSLISNLFQCPASPWVQEEELAPKMLCLKQCQPVA